MLILFLNFFLSFTFISMCLYLHIRSMHLKVPSHAANIMVFMVFKTISIVSSNKFHYQSITCPYSEMQWKLLYMNETWLNINQMPWQAFHSIVPIFLLPFATGFQKGKIPLVHESFHLAYFCNNVTSETTLFCVCVISVSSSHHCLAWLHAHVNQLKAYYTVADMEKHVTSLQKC